MKTLMILAISATSLVAGTATFDEQNRIISAHVGSQGNYYDLEFYYETAFDQIQPPIEIPLGTKVMYFRDHVTLPNNATNSVYFPLDYDEGIPTLLHVWQYPVNDPPLPDGNGTDAWLGVGNAPRWDQGWTRMSSSPATPGDANYDRVFNSDDLVQVAAGGRYETLEPASWELGNWNGDRYFDSGDLITAAATSSYESGSLAVIVPEPSACLLVLIGCLLLGKRR